VPGGGQSAAWSLRYQYLRTLEALMDAVERAFPGDGATRAGLLRGVNALHSGDLDLAGRCLEEFRSRDGASSRMSEPRQWSGWRSVANVLDDALAIEKAKADGFTRPAARQHEYSGAARYMLLPPYLQLALVQCPPELLPLLAALTIVATGYTRPLGSRSVPACHLLQGALKYLGLQGQVIAASAHVLHDASGVADDIGECQQAPIVRDDGDCDGHAVLWVESSRRLVDPTVLQLQHLHAAAEDNTSFGVPVMVPLPSLDSLLDPVPGTAVMCLRPPLVISWVAQPRWAQAVTPVPGSDLDTGLSYGKLALAHVIFELIQGLRNFRSDMAQVNALYPILADLLDGRSHLPGLLAEPPAAFLRICRSSDASN